MPAVLRPFVRGGGGPMLREFKFRIGLTAVLEPFMNHLNPIALAYSLCP